MAGSEINVMQNATAYNASSLTGSSVACGSDAGLIVWVPNIGGAYDGSLTIEGSLDGTNWFALAIYDVTDGVLDSSFTISLTKAYFVPTIAGLTVRARMSGGTKGTLTVNSRRTTPLWGIRGA